jgi:hypothetical protein
VNGTITVQQIQEVVNVLASPSSTAIVNWASGAVYSVSGMTANFTANITNLPTTSSRIYIVTFILNQGGTPYFINALQIGGVSVTLRWAGALAPTATANRVEFETFALFYNGTAWASYGQYASYG